MSTDAKVIWIDDKWFRIHFAKHIQRGELYYSILWIENEFGDDSPEMYDKAMEALEYA